MKKLLRKSAFVCCFLMASVMGMAQKSATVIVYESSLDEGRMAVYGMSPNGKWAALTSGSQGSYSNPILWNLETNEKVSLLGPDDTMNSQIEVNDAADNGLAVGAYENIPAYYKEGKWHQLPVPEGYTIGTIKAVSADGSVMVGNVSDGSFVKVKACKWVNNELVELNVPATDSRGVKVDTAMLFDVSADGKIVWGFLNYSYPDSCTPMIWTPEPQTVCEDIYYNEAGDRNYTAIYESVVMSLNGKYMAGYVSYDAGTDNFNKDAGFFYNVSTKKTSVYAEDEVFTCGYAIDNNGVIYEANENGTAVRQAYIRINGQQFDLVDFLKKEYNYDLLAGGLLRSLGTTMAVSEDCKTIVGFEGPGRNWCLKLSDAPGLADAIQVNEKEMLNVLVDGKQLIVEGNAKYISITDLTGKIVIEHPLYSSNVNLSELSQGIYVVTIVADGENLVRKIAIK